MQAQQDLSAQVNRQWLGTTVEALIDEADPSDPALFVGRTSADCPEVDGVVYVKSPAVALKPGDCVRVRIVDTYEYDLVGELAR
jgi:ribosomal protein S12 methylthiotransferase